MRSMDYLVSLYPDKTGSELLAIQEAEKVKAKMEFELRNKNKLELIKEINTNGGYYKGTFGLTQHFYYSFFNMQLIEGDIYCDVNCITCFFEDDRTHIEARIVTFKKFENYGVGIYTKVLKDDFDKVLDYYKKSKQIFW